MTVNGVSSNGVPFTVESFSRALYGFSIQTPGGAEGYDPVGNVTGYTDSVNGTWSFTYDSLNRVATATGSQSNNSYPNYCWQYDNFGNRLWQTSSATPYALTAGGANACPVTIGPSSWTQYNGTVNGSNNNQMSGTSQNVNQGQYYDASGNITYDTINSYLYDADGRICRATIVFRDHHHDPVSLRCRGPSRGQGEHHKLDGWLRHHAKWVHCHHCLCAWSRRRSDD